MPGQLSPPSPHGDSPSHRLIKIARGEIAGNSPTEGEAKPSGSPNEDAGDTEPEGKYSLFTRAATAASNTRASKAVGWTERLGQYLSPLGALPEKNRYLARRYLALGEVAEAEDLGRKVYDPSSAPPTPRSGRSTTT